MTPIDDDTFKSEGYILHQKLKTVPSYLTVEVCQTEFPFITGCCWATLGHLAGAGHGRCLLTYLLTISCLPKCKFLSVLCPALPPSPANNAVSHGSRTRWTLLRTGLLLLRSSGAETAAQLDARNTDTDATHFFHLRHFCSTSSFTFHR